MPESLEVTLARIEERQKSQDEKLDALAVNQKDMFKFVEEFHTFKGKVTLIGTAGMAIISIAVNWLFNKVGGE